MTEPILTLRDVRYRYPGATWELQVSRLEVLEGERVAVIGPNGSGKSTLLKLAARVLHPERGGVFFRNTNLEALDRKTLARHVAYLPQVVTSLFDFTVEDVVRMGRYPHQDGFRRQGARDDEVVEAALEATNLVSLRARRLSHLSGGEYKRVLLASVLAQEPELLLLDEPAAALDLEHQVRLHRLLEDLSTRGMAVVSITHDLNLASLFFDRLIVLEEGRVPYQGPPETVLTAKNMARVYGGEVVVDAHPQADRPVVLPRR